MTDLEKWADPAMFAAEPIQGAGSDETGVLPKVHLLHMNDDPLGSIAAMCRMYEGKPTYSLSDISNDERAHYFRQVQKTHLQAPLEAVKFHFYLEGVDRAFTHQHVRQRTAVYAQESMRFAVKGDLVHESTIPPHVAGDDKLTEIWDSTLNRIQDAYDKLIAAGVPAEDARGLMPHCVATRIHYVTDLRALSDHAGNRLCTQAQFHWRLVFSQIVQSIRHYALSPDTNVPSGNDWQFIELASSPLFRPKCFQLGHCPFQASFDRHCSIRDKVDALRADGFEPEEWEANTKHPEERNLIHPEEWLMNPDAAIRRK